MVARLHASNTTGVEIRVFTEAGGGGGHTYELLLFGGTLYGHALSLTLSSLEKVLYVVGLENARTDCRV